MKRFLFEDCTFDFLLDYRNWLLDYKKHTRSTVNNRLAVIKPYVRYASSRDVSLPQVYLSITDVPFLRVEKKIRPIIEDRSTLKVFLDAPPNTRTGCRDTMIRADELINIRLKDVNLKVAAPYILIKGKGKKERTVPISENVVSLIESYMAEYHDGESAGSSVPFIYTASHCEIHSMLERNVERIVKKYADIVRKDHPELPNPVYSHMLRRTRGTYLYRDGVAIETIAVAMGHSSIQTTKDHYSFPSLEQKRKAMEIGNPVISSGNEVPE